MHRLRYFLLGVVVLTAACGGDKPTSPTTTTSTDTTTTTVAQPTTTEEFSGTLPVGGFKFYSFTTSTNGTINVTLTSVSGQFVPSTVTLGLGLGQPSGTDCTATTSVNTAAGTTAQVTGTYAPGVYCARVADVGNLFAPATFTISVAYP